MSKTVAPLVSVIIPFLNPGEWLIEAVNSVLVQDYKNWEIVLIDDGSIEKDSTIAKNYSAKFSDRIYYIEHPGHVNKGLPASRNLGIRHSNGDYIAFLDADDCWLNEKLNNQINLFNQYPEITMICEASMFWYSWNNKQEKDIPTYIGVKAKVYPPYVLSKKLYPLGTGQPPCPSGIMIKKEALNRNGGFEESFSGMYQLYEDQAFLAKLYLNEIILISDIANNLYRKRVNSMSSSANDEVVYNKVRNFFFLWLESYIKTHRIDDEEIIQLINSRINKGLIDPELIDN